MSIDGPAQSAQASQPSSQTQQQHNVARQTPRHPPPHAPPFCCGGGACWYCICYNLNQFGKTVFKRLNIPVVALEGPVGSQPAEEGNLAEDNRLVGTPGES